MKLLPDPLGKEFDRPPRTVRVLSEDDLLIIDVVPAVLAAPRPVDTSNPVWRALEGASEVRQANRFLRIAYELVIGVVVVDEGRPHPARWHDEVYALYRKEPSIGPLFIVSDSPWHAEVQDWQGGDDPGLKHYCSASECNLIDILAVRRDSWWLPNDRSSIDQWRG